LTLEANERFVTSGIAVKDADETLVQAHLGPLALPGGDFQNEQYRMGSS
jgi:hypothetical protein